MKSFIQRYYHFILYIPLFLVSIYLCQEDLYKGIFLLILFSLWCVISIKKKGYLTTLFFLFFLVPFNITLQIKSIPHDPYVSGIFVNYLVPTLSILDIFISILLLQLLLEKNKLFKELILDKDIIFFFVALILQNIFIQNFLTLFLTLRFIIYFFTFILILRTLKEDIKERNILQKIYVKVLIILTILIQGIIGIYQFLKGVSLGVYFLGESKIASGMFGSSYIDINGEAFLRAYGTFPHPNILAGWYILMFFVSITFYLRSKNKLYLATALLTVFLSIFTFSRLIILLYTICLLILFFIYFFKKNTIKSLSYLLFYRFLNIFSNTDSSWNERIKLLKMNIRILRENLLGTGLGNSISHYEQNIPLTQGGKFILEPVHNIWILNWVELGLAIGTYYIYLLYRYFLKGIKMNSIKWLIFICLFTISLFDHYFFSLPQGNIMFFSFLILLSDLKL